MDRPQEGYTEYSPTLFNAGLYLGSRHFFPAKSSLRRRQDREKMMQMNFKRGVRTQTSETDGLSVVS